MAVQITDAFEIDGFVQQRKELEALLMGNPAMEKKVQGIIRKVLMAVRRNLSNEAKAKTTMKSDPRQAYKAVKTTVYRQILGGSVSILNKKRRGAGSSYTPERHPSPRGGNRRTRSAETIRRQSYMGADRAFVLRFLNEGTPGDRSIQFTPDPHREKVKRGSRGGNVRKYGKTVNTGYRGHIAPRNWFGSRSHAEMRTAADNLSKYIDDLIKQELS